MQERTRARFDHVYLDYFRFPPTYMHKAYVDVPSMLRARLPLLCRGERLIGVANLPELSAATEEHWQLIWQGPTNDQGLS